MSGRALTVQEVLDNLPHGKQNLLWYFSQATEEERYNGTVWYPTVNKACHEIAERYGIKHDTVMRVVACLSPQLPWVDNLSAAETVIRYYLAGGNVPSHDRYPAEKLLPLSKEVDCPISANVTGPNKLKALWILQGYDDALSGPKVESFYSNICYCELSGKGTMDTHAINAWRKAHDIIESVTVSNSHNHYRIIEADYQYCADVVNMTIEQFQALVWEVFRRIRSAFTKQVQGVGKGAKGKR